MSSLLRDKLFLLATFFVGATAIFSAGFLHPDEHYQILELLNNKLVGKIIDPSIFNWDYHLRIRSWMQPFLYYTLTAPLKFLSGFQLATFLRLFNGFFGLFAISKFISLYQLTNDNEKRARTLFYTLAIWFVPFLLVRTNSESLSTSFFLIGYTFYENKKKPYSMIFLSLSFLIRYQMALVICPLILIDLFKRKICPFTLLKMTGVFIVMTSLGVVIDYWGYGVFSVTPYNYFFENLIQDKASNFGTSPFYYYFTKPLIKGIPPISLVVAALSLQFLYKRSKDSLTWALLCFIIVHSMIPHKEVRFLSFIYIVLAIFTALSLEELQLKKTKGLLIIFFSFNFLIMLKTSFTPAHSRISLYKEVYGKEYQQLYVPKGSPPFKFTMPFYMDRVIETKPITGSIQNEYRVLTSQFRDFKKYEVKSECKLTYSQYPKWIEELNFFNWLKRSSFHAIWKCSTLSPM